ncbi:MAG: RluA family pseudouridine synthase [Pirellulales bacterium]|nr:RluA family pseudouridine synthase [Pirellulales bacterium]
MSRPLEILYEDNHLLAINKPAEIATMGATAGKPSMHGLAQRYIKQKYNKPGNVYLGVVSRLDAVVSGVLLFARTSKAAARLSAQFAAGSPEKIYLAVLQSELRKNQLGHPPGRISDAGHNVLEDWLWKNEGKHRMEVVSRDQPGAKFARLAWKSLAVANGRSLVAIRLETGRKHQIRVQWTDRGYPIMGDVKYGATRHRHPGIGLHAARLTVQHPTKKSAIEFAAPPPPWWRAVGFPDELLDVASLSWRGV